VQPPFAICSHLNPMAPIHQSSQHAGHMQRGIEVTARIVSHPLEEHLPDHLSNSKNYKTPDGEPLQCRDRVVLMTIFESVEIFSLGM